MFFVFSEASGTYSDILDVSDGGASSIGDFSTGGLTY